MILPAFDTPVMIRVPDREVLSGVVSYGGPGWLDIEPKHAPRTPISFLERHAVFLEYVDPAGLVRLRGHVSLSPASPRYGTPTLRFNHAQNVQLLRARTHAGGIVHARVNLVKAVGDGVAHATVTVAVGTKEFAVRELPGAFEGDLYDFTIWPGGNEPSVSGKASVTRIAAKGHVVLDYVMVAEFERERLGRLLIARGT
ncbi:MAG TPA: hypothetical protein VLK59_00750 [Solirubrobacteraceae bacterium]|nr:hypothetical protein [Solirubrobacteraceae bacterium]